MKQFLLLLLLIIILVAVSWFKPVFCQTLDNNELIQKYGQFQSHMTGADSAYKSPEIFGEQPAAQAPVANVNEGNQQVKESLEPFGYDLFGSPSELSPPSDVADLSDYVLGPGDNIVIYLWGKVEKEYNLTVDRQGKIFIPKMGEIVVWGMPMEEFESKATQKLSTIYTDFKISVSLGKIRSIRIYMTGEVKKPGAYTISSLTTLFNALYLAGGPNKRGSMRDIKLIRNNEIETTLDLYQFLLKGDSKTDVRLESGDAVFIPVSGSRVTIKGEIKRPGIYELLGREKVSQLLELAGGRTAEAYLDRIMLDRISPNDEREVRDLNLNADHNGVDDIELADGDILSLFSVYEMKRNIVCIDGMVKHPGEFERTDTTTLKSLIESGELLPENVYRERANLFRRYADRRTEIIPINLDDILSGRQTVMLQDLDSIYIYSIDEVKRQKFVYVEGEIKNPGQYKYYDNMTVSDLIFLAGNLNKNAYQLNVEVARTDSLGKVRLENVNLNEAEHCPFPLQEDDRIFVRKMPEWFLHRTVTIEGEVEFPGQYALRSRNETLYDLIMRAGGFTDNAFVPGTIFKRQSIGNRLERQNLPEIIANSQPLREDSSGTIRKVEVVKFNPDNMNRIIIDMKRLMSTAGVEGNLTLQTNDYVYIPEIPSGISVLGAVGANGTIKYTVGKKVSYYIERAGNFTNQACKNGTQLIKADGRVYAKGGTLGKQVELGDVIVVPVEIKKDHDWLKTLSTSMSIIGGLVTTALIIDRL